MFKINVAVWRSRRVHSVFTACPQRLHSVAGDYTARPSAIFNFLERCGDAVKPLSHQSGVLTAFPQRLKKLQNADVRAVQTPATLCKRCGNAVQSSRTPCGGVYFEHAQNKRCGLAFPQRVRQHAVATLWGLLERRGRVVSAPCVRCKDAV